VAQITLDYEKGVPCGLILRPRDETERRRALGVYGARVNTKNSDIRWHLEPLVIDDLRMVLPDLEVLPRGRAWWEMHQTLARGSLDLASRKDVAVPDYPLADKLYPHQRTGAAWLHYVPRGILGDDVGVGKTLTMLVAGRGANTNLIVTMNGIKQHWADHVHRWLNRDVGIVTGTKLQRMHTINAGYKWLIINHDMLRMDAFPELRARNWDNVMLDEAHLFQGRHSSRADGAASLRTDKLMMATATPVWNRPESIWRLLNIIDKPRFSSFWRFVGEYCDAVSNPFGGTQVIGIKRSERERLQSVIAPFLLIRRKEDVLPDLPPKVYSTYTYKLTSAQRKQYEEIKKSLRQLDDNGNIIKVYPAAINTLMDLRMLVSAPSTRGISGGSPKDALIDDLLDPIIDAGRKVIVFTWYTEYAEYLAQRLARRGTVLVTGETRHRDAVVESFRTGDAPILVATIGAAGTGIDIIEATAAIFAEGSYVPNHNVQAEGRLHRIGINTSPEIIRIQAANTAEQIIWERSDANQTEAEELLSFGGFINSVVRQAA
jgi:SNF2 family DNA or RNA helicase